jgi:hypothetical protein
LSIFAERKTASFFGNFVEKVAVLRRRYFAIAALKTQLFSFYSCFSICAPGATCLSKSSIAFERSFIASVRFTVV